MRWTASVKLNFLIKRRNGTLTQAELDEALISLPEIESWERAFNKHGLRGLKTTRLQSYRTIKSRQTK